MLNITKNVIKKAISRYIKITIYSKVTLELSIRTNIFTLITEEIKREKKDIQYYYINKK